MALVAMECDLENCPTWDDSAIGAGISWRPDVVDVRFSDRRWSLASDERDGRTFSRDGSEIDRVLAWLAGSTFTVAYVEVTLHEEVLTHDALIDRLTAAGWHVHTTRYVFAGSKSQVREGISARISIGGAGWIDGEFTVGSETVSLQASSVLDNGWEDLLVELTKVVSGAEAAHARWWEEPYYAHFRFTPITPDRARMLITSEDHDPEQTDVIEKVLLDAEVSVRALAAAVAESSRSLLDRYPHAEIGAAWRTEAYLPLEALAGLEQALAAAAPG